MGTVKPLTKPYRSLSEQQKLFIEYYIQTQNALEALRRTGYKGKSINSRASVLRKQLMPYIEERMAKIFEKNHRVLIADTDEIMQILTRIARGEEKDAFGLDTTNQDKLKALELLGKANQLYVDRVKADTSLDINVSLVEEESGLLIDGEKVEEYNASIDDGSEVKMLGEGEV